MNIPSWVAVLAVSPAVLAISAALSYYQLHLVLRGQVGAAAILSPLLSAPLIVLCMGVVSLLSKNMAPSPSETIIGAALALGVIAGLMGIVWSRQRAMQANKSLNSDAGKAGAG